MPECGQNQSRMGSLRLGSFLTRILHSRTSGGDVLGSSQTQHVTSEQGCDGSGQTPDRVRVGAEEVGKKRLENYGCS